MKTKLSPFSFVLLIPLVLISLGSCDDIFGSAADIADNVWDGIDHSSSTLLKTLPSLDISTYDLYLQSADRRTDAVSARKQESESVVGDTDEWSRGAGFAKALRNRSIAFSRKAEYLVDLLKVLDTAFEQMDIASQTTYLRLNNISLPFLSGTYDADLRVVSDESNDRISVDIAVDGTVRMQVYSHGQDDDDEQTHIAQVWMDLEFGNNENWERQWIRVDTTETDTVRIDFTQTGQSSWGSETESTDLDYNYIGSLVQETGDENQYNHAEGAFHEDFSGAEDFAYVVRYASRFDSEYGATVALQEHIRTDGSDSDQTDLYGPEAWSAAENKVEDSTDKGVSAYYEAIKGIQEADLPSIVDKEKGLSVDRISGDAWPDDWDGSIPDGQTAAVLDFTQIPQELAPSYRAWDKYDDLTTFTDLENENPEDIFAAID